MKKRNEIQEMMRVAEIPVKEQEVLLAVFDRLNACGVTVRWRETEQVYAADCRSLPVDEIDRVDAEAAACGVPSFPARWLFFVSLAYALLAHYEQAGLGRDEWLGVMADLRCKGAECKQRFGMWGCSSRVWFSGFFRMERFALGRAQFEKKYYAGETRTVEGRIIREGDPVVQLHIPSGGPLRHEDLLASYARAGEFFAPFCGEAVVVWAATWMFSSIHLNRLDPRSNLCLFAADYTCVREWEDPDNTDLWRIFYDKAVGDPAAWPRETALQRIYADHIAAGGCMTKGEGFLVL